MIGQDRPKRPRGRPTLAAQSYEEAFARLQAGTLPKRPRNEYERIALWQSPGRKPQYGSPTRAAEQLARYMLDCGDALTLNAAAKTAAAIYKVNATNVRNYASKAINGRRVSKTVRVPREYAQLVGSEIVTGKVPIIEKVVIESLNYQGSPGD